MTLSRPCVKASAIADTIDSMNTLIYLHEPTLTIIACIHSRIHSYVWIFPYFGAIFPDNYQDSNLWCGYTSEEVHTIKNALKGSMSIGISEGFQERFNSFDERFVDFAGKVTGYRETYQQNHQFQQTSLIYDMAGEL